MSVQMIIRLDPLLKEKANKFARKEGKTLSEIVRELLEKYIKERDMSAYINDLWENIGNELLEKDITEKDIEKAIKQVRSENA